MAPGNADLASRTEHTAAALQKTASSIEELTATIRDGAVGACEADAQAPDAAAVAREGGAVVAGLVTTMNEIDRQAQKIAEILGVIDGIAFQMNILALIVTSVERIDTGMGKVRLAGETMARIVESIEQVSASVGSISSAAEHQARGIDEVSRAAAEIDRHTQQNAALVEEAGAATESPRTQARALAAMLERFRTA